MMTHWSICQLVPVSVSLVALCFNGFMWFRCAWQFHAVVVKWTGFCHNFWPCLFSLDICFFSSFCLSKAVCQVCAPLRSQNAPLPRILKTLPPLYVLYMNQTVSWQMETTPNMERTEVMERIYEFFYSCLTNDLFRS